MNLLHVPFSTRQFAHHFRGIVNSELYKSSRIGRKCGAKTSDGQIQDAEGGFMGEEWDKYMKQRRNLQLYLYMTT
jgi:hypothetical protein